MQDYLKKISILLLVVFILTTIFVSVAQASLWDTIKAWVTINPLSVDVSAPAKVEVNEVFIVEAKVINKGEEKIEKAKGEIFLPPGLVLLKKDPVQKIGVIPPEKEKPPKKEKPSKKEITIFWSVKGEKVGNHIISVKVSGELKGQLVSAEDSTMVKVIKPLPKGKTLKWFQNLFDFFQERFGY